LLFFLLESCNNGQHSFLPFSLLHLKYQMWEPIWIMYFRKLIFINFLG
jgi:hypothetical protein